MYLVLRNCDKRNSSWPFGVPCKPPPRLPSPGSARIICWLAAACRRWGVWGGKFSNLDECFIDIEFLGSPGRPGTFLVSTIVYLGLRAYLAKPVMPQLQATKKVEPLQNENSIVHGNYSRFAFPPPVSIFFEFILEFFGVALASAEPLAVVYRHGITPILHRAHECQIRSAPN